MVFTNVYNPRSAINRKSEYKETYVERGATIGANATLIGGIRVGKYSFIGAGTVVTRDVPAYALVVGNPGRQIGWMSEFGEQLNLPLRGDGTAICSKSGVRYRASGGQVAKDNI